MSEAADHEAGSIPAASAPDVSELVAEAAFSVLRRYVNITRDPPSDALTCDPRVSSCKRINFTSPSGEGTMAILAPNRLLRETHPRGAVPPAGVDLNDWLGELCNLIMGRFANLCIARGLDVHMSVPQACEPTMLNNPEGQRLAFWTGDHPLDLYIDLTPTGSAPLFSGEGERVIDDDVTFLQAPEPEEETP